MQQLVNRARLAAKAVRFYPPYWTSRVLGWPAGQKNYRRFVVICAARFGSNMLRSLLNAHSKVLVLGEIFRNNGQIGMDMPLFPTGRRAVQLRDERPKSFLAQEVFGSYPSHIRAVGFKLFYYQAREGRSRQLWEGLAADDGLCVIHLKRNNLLKSYLSRVSARESGQWVKRGGERSTIPPIRLDPELCLQYFQRIEDHQREADRLFASHESVVVHYEDLVANHLTAIAPVFSLLGVAFEPVQPMTVKQAKLPLHEAIENYQELTTTFHNTRWDRFFV